MITVINLNKLKEQIDILTKPYRHSEPDDDMKLIPERTCGQLFTDATELRADTFQSFDEPRKDEFICRFNRFFINNGKHCDGETCYSLRLLVSWIYGYDMCIEDYIEDDCDTSVADQIDDIIDNRLLRQLPIRRKN